MVKYSNINIKGNDHTFKYLVKYDEYDGIHNDDYDIIRIDNNIYFKYKGIDNLYKIDGIFTEIPDQIIENNIYRPNPDFSGRVNISVLFPEYAIETYSNGYYYVLCIKTVIGDYNICLGSFLINRFDAIALDRIKYEGANKYYECLNIPIIDPYELCYGDDWSDFRKELLGSKSHDKKDSNLYNVVINISLTPLIYNNDIYRLGDYMDGQNCINIYKNDNDYLNLSLTTNIDRELDYNEEPSFICKLNFNDYYEGDIQSYFDETYNKKLYKIKYNMIIGSADDLNYDYFIEKFEDISSCKFTKSIIKESGNFTGWVGWREGMSCRVSACIYTGTDEEYEELLYILSNSIPFTKELYKYFLNDGSDLNNIKLNNIDMINYQINAVNKIYNKVIKIEKNPNNIIKSIKITQEEV